MSEHEDPHFKRVLLKIGGEALAGPQGFGIDPTRAEEVASIVKQIHDLKYPDEQGGNKNVQVAVVIGGGNLWRGKAGIEKGMEQPTADHMGMLATVMNALALQDALERVGVTTRVQTAVEMRTVAEPYIRLRAIRHLEKDRVVIFGGGTGNPYFTTDTAGALRAMEINAEVLIKATKVDAIYDDDPKENPFARRFKKISYIDALNLRLRIMDSTAISLCMDHDMPIVVLNLWQEYSVQQFMVGKQVGTMIGPFANSVLE